MTIGHGQKWLRKRESAIAALLSAPTIKAAAKLAGISEPTLHRWMSRADFASDYQRAREKTLEMASEQLRHGTLAAVEVLREISSNRKAPSASRVQAARSFLECTGLLKGLAVTVNNTIPTDSEGINESIAQELRSMLATDAHFRQMVSGIIADVERSECEKQLLN